MKRLDHKVFVAGQLDPANLPALAADGFRMVVNNRPDDEEPGQPSSAEVASAAAAAGLEYRHIPVGSSGLSQNQVAAMTEALSSADGKMLAFCRSGTRSTYLWALSQAAAGHDAEEIARKAAEAGYDLTPIRTFLG